MKSKINQLVYYALYLPAFVLLAVLPAMVKAQNKIAPLNPKLEAIAKPQSTINWIDFKAEASINPATVFTQYKEAFDLGKDDEMKVAKMENDPLGFTHYRYRQYYKNHPVLYGEYIVHQQPDGIVRSANGLLLTGLKDGGTPSLTEAQALQQALNFMKAKRYLWQNAEMEKALKGKEKNDKATYYPIGDLVYAPSVNDEAIQPSAYRLAWHFKVYTDDRDVIAKSVYVDAATGKVIHYKDIAMNCSTGSGTSAFNGTVSFNTRFNGNAYESHNDCQATDIYVFNCNGGAAANNFYTDLNNVWNLSTQQSAVQAQWGAQKTYEYYKNLHARSSWDNASGNLIVYNNAYAGSNNACWGCTGNSTIFYAGNTSAATDDWNTNDIMGHEFTHGVTQAAAGLVYSYESGALNESFSDIFGEMVESTSEGVCDYLVGGDRGAIRSLINPNAYGDPDTYLGTNWYTGTGDNGGVHTNSGVQNHWFYLLSEGGTGTTDFGVPYSVTGITRFKARQIAYRALEVYLTSSSKYIDARKASLMAAWDLYGQCSPEIIAVGDAWHAVGVESQSAQFVKNACGTYSSGQFVQAISQMTAANGCATTVNSTTNIVHFTARDRVTLYPGFKATNGSRFIAYLEPCSSTMWKSGMDNAPMSDVEKGIKTNVPLVYERENKEVVKETRAATETISINPNPFASRFELTIHSIQDQKAQVMVYNSLGLKVKEKSGINVTKGMSKISFDCNELPKGMYLVEIIMGEVKTVKKVMKL